MGWRKKPTAISYSGYLNGVVALVFWSRLIVTAWNKRSQVKAKLKKHPVKKSKKKSITTNEAALIGFAAFAVSMFSLPFAAWSLGRGSKELLNIVFYAFVSAVIGLLVSYVATRA